MRRNLNGRKRIKLVFLKGMPKAKKSVLAAKENL